MSFWVKLFKKDILRKVVALFFAILLYWTMTSKNGVEEMFDNVRIDIHYPEGIVNVEDKEYYVKLYCSGSKHMLDTLHNTGLKGNFKVSIKNYVEGVPYTIKLSPDDFKVPLGVTVGRVVPDELVLNLEPRISRTVPVKPYYDDSKLKEDYLIKNVTVTPEEVNIVGPASAVNALSEIKTMEIPLDNSITDNFDYTVNLAGPENLIVNPRVVSCRLTVDKEFTVKEMNDVPMAIQMRGGDQEFKIKLDKTAVNVQLYGSRSDLEKIGYNQIYAFIDGANLKQKGVFDLEVKCFIDSDGKVEIRDITPKIIRVTVK
ncbi:MAG: hypothetical protein IJW31_03315 [Lentisphaeria bacterium]|nr:hypothetical protein [Lentisphaeria bacterium]